MTTIDRDLLVAKGTIDALLFLEFHTDSATTSEVAKKMDVSTGTARTRLSTLADAGLLSESAELRDGTPTRVHEVTDGGSEVASKLTKLLNEDSDRLESTTDSDE
jgi:predicted ArsR family transcriptional regulator